MITTKWPRLLVVGENVTEEQADEILIRTAGWDYIGGNDRAFEKLIEDTAAEFGRPREPERSGDQDTHLANLRAYWDAQRAWAERGGLLNLSYLHNDQIMSSWIGGPHGWCDWQGRIGCSTFNIGKWPSDEEVTDDWTAIAEAFPYLDLTAQCIDDEGEGEPAAEWRVKDGKVEYNPQPAKQLRTIREAPFLAVLMPGGERGVSPERLRTALSRVFGAGGEQ